MKVLVGPVNNARDPQKKASAGKHAKCASQMEAKRALDLDYKWKLFHYLAYFCYYLWASLHFLALFMGPIVLFQLTFTFIYSTFSNNFSISTK